MPYEKFIYYKTSYKTLCIDKKFCAVQKIIWCCTKITGIHECYYLIFAVMGRQTNKVLQKASNRLQNLKVQIT